MDQKLNIQVKDGTNVLLLGQALTPKEPKLVVIGGDFTTVSRFINQRIAAKTEGLQAIDSKTALITCNEKDLSICLETDPNDPFGTKVTAKAEYSKELGAFGINEGTYHKREDLLKLLRFHKRYFSDLEKYQELYDAYQSFTARATKDIAASSDTRGNMVKNFSKQVETNIPHEFFLEIPIFQGEKKEKFLVEICLEESADSVRFYFESVELADLIEVRKQEMFDRELASCEGLCVIFK